jgi:transcription initiation factor TFIID subunit TAF12
MNGSFSQPALPSLDGSHHSMSLAPTVTRPLQDSLQQQPQQPQQQQQQQQQQMSCNTGNESGINGLVPRGGTFGGYEDSNGHAQPSPYYEQDAKPQIYTVSIINLYHILSACMLTYS